MGSGSGLGRAVPHIYNIYRKGDHERYEGRKLGFLLGSTKFTQPQVRRR